MIVDVFLNLIRDAMYGNTVTWPTHIGIGTSSTAATASDTTLGAEVYPYGSQRAEISYKTKSNPKKVVYHLSILPAQANGESLKEVSAFNAGSGGTMANRFVHNAINKTSSFELVYQISIELSDV